MTEFGNKPIAEAFEPEGTRSKRSAKVMIVEDEAIIALDLEKSVIRAGFEVTGKAQSGTAALSEIERERPDIVLMDIRIKGDMDGVQMAEIIRTRYALPVIYLTSHSDLATVERALASEPYGYLIKPAANASLRVTITIALDKHRIECEHQNGRRMLSAVLHGMPEAVFFSDHTGKVLFLNRAAEEMTGWRLQEAFARNISEIAPIVDAAGQAVSSVLPNKLGAPGTTIRLPRNSSLLARDGRRVDVCGRFSVAAVGDHTGLFVILHDSSFENREDQRFLQEQQIHAAGELAQDVARELFVLFELIDDAVAGASRSSGQDLDLIRKASRVGSGMSQQLLELGQSPESAHVVNVERDLLSSQSLLQKICGKDIQLEISAAPSLGYIVSTGSHFQQLLVNLVLEGCRRLPGQGDMLLGADVHSQSGSPQQTGSYVHLFVRSEKSLNAEVNLSFSRDPELPGVGLAIVHAVAISAGGFTRVSEPAGGDFMLEVFLPRQESPRLLTISSKENSRTVLLVGLPAGISERLKIVPKDRVMFLEGADPNEARWIAELFEGDIDLVIWNENRFSPELLENAGSRIHIRRPDLSFLNIVVGEEVTAAELLQIDNAIEGLFHKKLRGAVASSSK